MNSSVSPIPCRRWCRPLDSGSGRPDLAGVPRFAGAPGRI